MPLVDIGRGSIVVEIMLACWISRGREPWTRLTLGRWESTAGKAARDWLFNNFMIDSENAPMPRGIAWAEAICNTPLPEEKTILQKVWVVPGRQDVNVVASEEPTAK